MDFRQLQFFLAVAENRSFTSAGEQLHVAQSAISRKVKMLEEELGESLFKRVSHNVYLTPAGEVMLRYTRRIFREAHNAALEISELAKMTRGSIRIGAGMTATIYLLPPILRSFRKKYPAVELQVVTGPAESLVSQIRNNEIDVGVITLPVSDPALDVISIHQEEMVVVASPENVRLQDKNSLSAAEVCEYPMIAFARGTTTRGLIDDYFGRLRLTPKIVMESETVATIKPLVQIDLGISLLPLRAVAPELQRGELHSLRLRDRKLIREVGLVFHRSNHLPKTLIELISLVRAEALEAPQVALDSQTSPAVEIPQEPAETGKNLKAAAAVAGPAQGGVES